MRFLHKNVLYLLLLHLLFSIVLPACSSNENPSISYPQGSYEFVNVNADSLFQQQTVYVPVYSDIYHLSGDERFLLTVTTIVRNTSLTDTIYVHSVNYFDSKGGLLRKYLQKTISIAPLASADFIVEYLENKGGAGASFVIKWGSKSTTVKPLIQAVMIGTLSQLGISFITEGVVMESLPDSISR